MTYTSLSPIIDPVWDMLSPQFDHYFNLYTTQGVWNHEVLFPTSGTLRGSTTQKNTQTEGTTYGIQNHPLGLDYTIEITVYVCYSNREFGFKVRDP